MRKISQSLKIDDRSWIQQHKWLILRRFSQLSIQILFLLGPWFGIWWLKGSLSANMVLGTIPLTDPFVFTQLISSGFWPSFDLILGFLIVVFFYLIVGGRVYCSWVCPVNIVTDAARFLRLRMGIRKSTSLSRNTRYWLLAMILIATAYTGTLIWELINPVTMVTRGLLYGMGSAWYFLLAIFLYDLFITKNGWCGHLCPMGATYSLIGKFSLLKINAFARSKCDDCAECYYVCPEPQILKPVLKGSAESSTIIQPSECNNCGRCIDVCPEKVFKFSPRFITQTELILKVENVE